MTDAKALLKAAMVAIARETNSTQMILQVLDLPEARRFAATAADLAQAGAMETPAERIEREGRELLAEFDALGGGREAASIIAARRVGRADPAGVERMAQRIRTLARKREKRSRCV